MIDKILFQIEACAACQAESGREDARMMIVQHGATIYPSERLIPVERTQIADSAPLKFDLYFFCKSACHSTAPFRLAFGVFTRNRRLRDDEMIYGVHQDRCDVKFPLEIK